MSTLSCSLTRTEAQCAMSSYDTFTKTFCNIDCAFENKTVWIQLTTIIIVVLVVFQAFANCFIIKRVELSRQNRIEEPLYFAEKFTLGATTAVQTIILLANVALVNLVFFWNSFPATIALSWKDNVNYCVQGG